MVIAAGPRIISSTMGPITLAEAESGSVSISVTFDRSITASSFDSSVLGLYPNVEVFFLGTTDTSSFVPLEVTDISPVDLSDGLASEFTITFDPTPPGANSATYNYVGTYSYLIAPDNLVTGVAINAPVESYVTLADMLATGSRVVGLSNTAGLVGGEAVSGTGIPAGTTISSVLTLPFVGTLTDGSTAVTSITTTTGLVAGEEVIGVGIPSGTTISSINGLTSIILSAPATISGSDGLLASGIRLSASATASGSESLAVLPCTTPTTRTPTARMNPRRRHSSAS